MKVHIHLLPFLFLLQACQFGCKDDETLIRTAIFRLASHESIMDLSWVSDEAFFDNIYPDSTAIPIGSTGLIYKRSYKLERAYMESNERLMKNSFQALGLNVDKASPESVLHYPGSDRSSPFGASYLVRLRLDSGPAFILAKVLYYDGCPRLTRLMWEPNSWEIHVEKRFRKYWEGRKQ